MHKYDVNYELEQLKDHVAKLMDYGNIKVLDFRNPESDEKYIRFLFEEDFYKVHISCYLGEISAICYPMTFETFSDYSNDVEKFEKYIVSSSCNAFYYDELKAREDLKNIFKENLDAATKLVCEGSYESLDDAIEDILLDFSSQRGLGDNGVGIIARYMHSIWEKFEEIGVKTTNIAEILLTAFNLATEQLKREGVGV